MNCTEYQHALHAYFMGRLANPEAERVETHAAACPECGALMARAKELSCREFTEFLNDYVDDALPPQRKLVFERHLEICADCRNYLQSYRETMKESALALGHALDVPPRPVPEGLILAVLRAAREKPES
jgi:anti-sigma factor RsiW